MSDSRKVFDDQIQGITLHILSVGFVSGLYDLNDVIQGYISLQIVLAVNLRKLEFSMESMQS